MSKLHAIARFRCVSLYRPRSTPLSESTLRACLIVASALALWSPPLTASTFDPAAGRYVLTALPDAEREAQRMDRMQLCDQQPAGRYVRKGETITITASAVPNGYDLEATVGFKPMWGSDLDQQEEPLDAGENRFVKAGFPTDFTNARITLRLRGDYLAIVTLGFGEIVRIFLNNLNHPINITNGPQGINMIDPLELFGWDISRPLKIGDDITINSLFLYYYVFLAFVVLSIILVQRLQISRVGRAWAAIRDDELAAKAIGINTRNMKLLAFSLGATFGGVAGGLFAAFQGFVSPESFSLMESIAVLTMVVFGGMGNLAGVVVGALALTALPEILRHVAVPVQQAVFNQVILDPEVLRMLLLSLAMIFMMLLRPAGLIPAHSRYSRPELVVGKPAPAEAAK